MRNRKVRILHEGREYYLVDGGRSSGSRALTFLLRLQPDEAPGEGAAIVPTDLGDCVAIASSQGDAVQVQPGHEELRPMLEQVVARYLEDFRSGRRRREGARHWFLSVEEQPLFDFHPAHPGGLAVLVFDSAEAAETAAAARRGIEARAIRVDEAGDLADFLAARAVEGFAGAVIDERDPVYFCLDDEGQPRFLRLLLDPRHHRVEHSLLEPDGTWKPYDGEMDLTPEVDQDAADEYMQARLGAVPFVGFREGMRFYRIEDRANPSAIVGVALGEGEGDEAEFCPVFHDADLGRAFLVEHRLTHHALAPVEDLRRLAAAAQREQKPLILQPDSHRARGGTLWVKDDRLVLDSFSGLWTSEDGVAFTRLATADDRRG